MDVSFPKEIEYILHSETDKLDYLQKIYLYMLNINNNFVNTAFDSFYDKISKTYNGTEINKILKAVNKYFDEELRCPYEIFNDDFVKIAMDCYTSIKRCINNPSNKLIKEKEMVKANKVRRFDSQTMMWLARRSGTTIAEKIGPKGVIPTMLTKFSLDTIENRHMMYLYNILYDNLVEKVYPANGILPCDNCQYCDRECFKRYETLQNLINLKNVIRKTDLKDVLKIKQFRQNNKLMEHKDYKQIWDAVKQLDYYEENCKNVWDNLKQRYQLYIFMKIVSKLITDKNIKIINSNIKFDNSEGQLNLLDNNSNKKVNEVKFYDKSKDTKIVIKLENEVIDVKIMGYETKDYIIYNEVLVDEKEYDLSNIFDKLNGYNDKVNELKDYEEFIPVLEEDINKLKEELDNNSKKLENNKQMLEDLKKELESLLYYINELKELREIEEEIEKEEFEAKQKYLEEELLKEESESKQKDLLEENESLEETEKLLDEINNDKYIDHKKLLKLEFDKNKEISIKQIKNLIINCKNTNFNDKSVRRDNRKKELISTERIKFLFQKVIKNGR